VPREAIDADVQRFIGEWHQRALIQKI